MNFEHEAATLSDIDAPAVQIIGREHLVIDGLIVTDTLGWARLQDASDITLRHMTFRRVAAHGTTGSVKIVRSTLNRITENSFEDGHDSLMVQDASDRNVIAGNLFKSGRHTLITIKCSSANIVRGNIFANAIQKGMEILDCEGGSDAPFRLDATKRNVVEQNVFLITRGAGTPHDYNAIQHGGQYTIVRRNAFIQDLAGGVNYHPGPCGRGELPAL
jgi:hypothetical protein